MSASTPATRAADRARLPLLEAQIEQLQIALNVLCSERTLIQNRLDSYSYPVLTLPNEIISEIFIQYLPFYPSCPPLLGDGSPTKLGQICRHWREIAHATPALWRAIELFVSELPTEHQLITAQTWLQRSHSLPLSIVMGNEVYGPDLEKALDHMLAHRMRWEYVALFLRTGAQLNSRLRLEGSAPLLLELDVQFVDMSWLTTVIGPLHVPRLSTAFLDCFQLEDPQHLQKLLPWGQLTKLFLQYVETGTVTILLRATPNLLHCRLHFMAETGWDVGILHLPRLKTLVIQAGEILSSLDDIYNLLLTLRAPALKRLHIDEGIIVAQASENPPPSLASIIKAFGCQLERLCIAEADSETSLEEYNAALPDVGHLELRQNSELPPETWGYWNLEELYGSGRS
ncbi:hypothetical protein C8F01DRAFT_1098981 [Mycena amicta]|nr:hypothetical protein C8F01DRAFT_1098981 [Mycena amicta]